MTPALAEIAPPPPADAARCHSHGCRCPRPGAPRRAKAVRSCHESTARSIAAACRHDPETTTPAGSPSYLAAAETPAVALVAHALVVTAPVRAVPDARPGVDPPPPRSIPT